MLAYAYFKALVSEAVPINRDWWHLLAGMIILGLCLATPHLRRRGLAVPVAFAIALTLGVTLEIIDFSGDIRNRVYPQWMEYVTDVIWTSLAPTVTLTALALRDRLSPQRALWRKTPSNPAPDRQMGAD